MLLLAFAPDGARAQAQGLQLDRSLGAPPSGRGPDLPTFLTADRIEGLGGAEVEAAGDAEIRRGDTTLNADRIQYFTDLDEAEATGNVRLRMGLDEMTGPRLRMRLGDSSGIFESPTYRLGQRTVRSRLKRGQQLGPQPITTTTPGDNRLRVDLEAHGTASAIRFEGDEHYRMSDATFTTCKPGQDDWYLDAREISIDMERDVGTVRGGSLTFFGVSTPRLPWFDFSLNNERKTGFLPPIFGTQRSVGAEIIQPFYWNIAPNYDATIAPRYMAKRGLQWLTQFRFLQPYFRGEARYEILPEDKELNERRWATALVGELNFRNGFTGLINYQKVSDDNYFRDLSGRLTIATQIYLPQQILGSYTSSWWNATANYQRFQTLQDPQNPVPIPYYREPQVVVNALRPVGPGIDVGFRGEYVSFGNSALVPTGQRATAYPSVAWPLVASYGFVKPKVGVTAVGYDLATLGSFTEKRPSLVVPIASVDSGLTFERDARWFGSEYVQTLEPRAYYLYVPFKDQTNLPVFDTTNTDLNYPQLFQENIFAGGDRVANANQLSIGATSRLIRPGDGQELVRGVIGQRYYFTEQKVTIPGLPVRTANISPLILGVAGRVAPNWSAELGVKYQFVNPTGFVSSSTGVRYSPAPASVASLAYRYTNQNLTAGAGTIQNVDAAAQWPLGGGFFGVGRWSYDVVGSKTVEALVGLEYNAGCWIIRGVAQQFQTSTAQQTTAFFVQLEFSGFARIGSNPLEVLRRNIPGYSLINQSTLDPRAPGAGFLDQGSRVVPIRSNTPSAYGTYD